MTKVQCDGWWEQVAYGRQAMEDLTISFQEDRITGSGWDIIGQFILTGTVQQDRIAFIKQYIGRHSVEYLGTYDGEGTMSGLWRIWGVFGGKWMIRFAAQRGQSTSVTNDEILELKPTAWEEVRPAEAFDCEP